MKTQSTQIAAQKKFEEIKAEFNCEFKEVIKFARLEASVGGSVYGDYQTRQTLDALLQYLVCQSFGVHHNVIQVMPSGPINKMLQFLILHTAFYAKFCKSYAGEFIHYSPIRYDCQTDFIFDFQPTLAKLREYFGEHLEQAWVDLSNEKRPHLAAITFQGSRAR